ncbi:uncharacterized mitochondrial protein AtMg01250-like [Rutidosis leptorrhynchoides]|uniref:uncharacterized mitochondrial protein AtMg01250-like n=1 Tax=Rutidosis leptorrhynchoides TaxID=125765 RepID=UPI003A998D18
MCLRSERTSILVNGSPTGEFEVQRGLRQGDPLSPFLFLIVMEGLHLMLHDYMNQNLIRGASVGIQGIKISHLLYADDVVIISDWDKNSLDRIFEVFNDFYHFSGLKINVNKSNLYGLGVIDSEVDDNASDIGCLRGTFPFLYLGMPMGINMNRISN